MCWASFNYAGARLSRERFWCDGDREVRVQTFSHIRVGIGQWLHFRWEPWPRAWIFTFVAFPECNIKISNLLKTFIIQIIIFLLRMNRNSLGCLWKYLQLKGAGLWFELLTYTAILSVSAEKMEIWDKQLNRHVRYVSQCSECQSQRSTILSFSPQKPKASPICICISKSPIQPMVVWSAKRKH